MWWVQNYMLFLTYPFSIQLGSKQTKSNWVPKLIHLFYYKTSKVDHIILISIVQIRWIQYYMLILRNSFYTWLKLSTNKIKIALQKYKISISMFCFSNTTKFIFHLILYCIFLVSLRLLNSKVLANSQKDSTLDI